LDLIVGTGDAEVSAHKARVGLVEVGYPSSLTHFLTPAPYLGYHGFLKLVERIVNCRNHSHAWRRMDAISRQQRDEEV